MTEILPHHISSAAEAIVRAFERNDENDYFSRFSPTCTFIFAPDDTVHADRASWHSAWGKLQESGWRVVSCRTLESGVRILAEGGVFWHVLETTAIVDGEPQTYRERETIVFEKSQEGLLAVHEHLSSVTEEGTAL
ncbi:ketosteroid isomerase [Nesterenkonia sp. AN1]|uniref:SnoaL-like protein n=1 Tax=Nesterenkonia aurantiaca TaxID=1436010 RepID=A0A4R7G6V9_9MICC|nr:MULTISPECIES: nuclear transport factor 2 family protein [Nesterenkonia]EXF23929.1 ketosteroid isomerase [Nesterenkonia sp. AN1]TDS86960.1 SnoaL-like protein [Nesterenkonia aurantiaca]